MRGNLREKAAPVLLGIFLLCNGNFFAQGRPSLVPSIPEGEYSTSVLVSFQIPPGTRILLSLDGSSLKENEKSVFLTVPKGVEHEFIIETELRSLLPDSSILSKQMFTYGLDLKAPSAPSFSIMETEGGRNIQMNLDEGGVIEYQLFHPFSASFASGTISPGASLFVPDGSFLCVAGIDRAGNRGPSATPEKTFLSLNTPPFKVVNPVPGNWANAQVLLIDSSPGTELRYSLDGSDPSLTGLAYEGPILLDTSGITTLRVSAADVYGQEWTDRILYTVNPRSNPAGFEIPNDTDIFDVGDFTELQIPQGFSYSLDETMPAFEDGKSILFSAVRGTRLFFPLSMSDGKISWRWIVVSGSVPAEEIVQPAEVKADIPAAEVTDTATSSVIDAPDVPPAPDATAAAAVDSIAAAGATPSEGIETPAVFIHDWFFVEIQYGFPVYYSLDSKTWSQYTRPVFVDRSKNATLQWYSSHWKDAGIQAVHLPAKPLLEGVPSKLLSAEPVFLSAGSSPFTLHYEVGTRYYPSLPDLSSPELASGLLLEVPHGTSMPFSVRIVAEYEGLIQGELDTRFVVDRKAPRTPLAGLAPDTAWSRESVTLAPSGEDLIKVSIKPALFSMDGNKFILKGDLTRPIDYTITLFAVDEAGNESPTVTRTLRVDRNALFVDSSFEGNGEHSGSPSAPFTSLDEALSAVRGKDDWRIYVKGSAILERSHTIQAHVSVIGDSALITAKADASLTVSGGSLFLSGCKINAVFTPRPETANSLSVPLPALIIVRNGTFSADKVEVILSGVHSGSILRASLSTIACTFSRFDLAASEYALLFDISDSVLNVADCAFSIAAQNSSILSLTSSQADLSRSSFTVTALSAGRAIEIWNTRIALNSLVLERKADVQMSRDTAFWFDDKSRVTSEAGIKVSGFLRYKPAIGKK